MNHIVLVGQIMRFIVQSILLQRYRRWDIIISSYMQSESCGEGCLNLHIVEGKFILVFG